MSAFWSGVTSASNFGEAECLGDGLGRGAVVTRQHDDAQALVAQGLQGRGRCGLDGIGNAEHACGLAVDGHEDGRGSSGAQGFGLRRQIIRRDVQFTEELCIAERNALALHHADGTLAGGRIKTHDAAQGEAA